MAKRETSDGDAAVQPVRSATEGSPPWRVEGSRRASDSPSGGRPAFWRQLALFTVVALTVNWLLAQALLAPPERIPVSYDVFRAQVEAGNVAEVLSTGDTIEGTFAEPVEVRPATGTPAAGPDQGAPGEELVAVERFTTQRPAFADDGLLELLLEHDTVVNARPADRVPLWQSLVFGFGPVLLLVALLAWLYTRGARGLAGGVGGLGRSRARRYEPEAGPRTTFDDVAGIDEVEAEVQEIVDFLRDPDRYRRLGATIPKGVLLSGPPGTGKTLLARAVAGEAGVPFFTVSAAEFIEMIVGVGASRVRDLFASAAKQAPAIIFIDELDAVGRVRGGTMQVGGQDEREQTLNQLLTEMDGFDGTEGVVVLAATNRPEVLDPALLRPGRFDRRITVNPPDTAGRRAILAVHTRAVPLADDVDLDVLAAATPGMAGADLRNVVNEGALLAGRRGHERVTRADLLDALEKVVLGTVRPLVMSPRERERTAYHESGHALLGMLTPGADPVRKISIVPRGHALGVTLQAPDADRYGYSERYLRGRLTGLLAGRAAEEVVYGEVTTGAENDLEQATALARQMVGRWGMSPRLGPVSALPPAGREQPFDPAGPSPVTRELVDEEVRRTLDECYADALDTLRRSRTELERLTRALLEHETLDAEQAYAAAGVRAADEPSDGRDQQVAAAAPATHAPERRTA